MAERDGTRDESLVEGLSSLPDGSFDDIEPVEGRRDEIYARTARVIRGYRWRRRIRLAAALLLAFAAGGFAGAGLLGDRTSPEQEPLPVATTDRAPRPEPRDLEAEARTALPGERGGLLRRAGDGYLSAAEPDPLSAARCYERLLAEEPDPVAETDDSWLLLYLKLARP
jgi:hypothetical protein